MQAPPFRLTCLHLLAATMDEEGANSDASEAYEQSEMLLYQAMVLEEGAAVCVCV